MHLKERKYLQDIFKDFDQKGQSLLAEQGFKIEDKIRISTKRDSLCWMNKILKSKIKIKISANKDCPFWLKLKYKEE